MSRPWNSMLAVGRLEQPHEAAPDGRLAAAGLAHQAERLPSLTASETSSTACTGPPRGSGALLHREVLLDVLGREQGAVRRCVTRLSARGRLVVLMRPTPCPRSWTCGLTLSARSRDRRAAQVEVIRRGRSAPRAGSSVHLSKACGQRGRKRQPCGRRISDGGDPVIENSRSGFGRSSRGIEPSSPQV